MDEVQMKVSAAIEAVKVMAKTIQAQPGHDPRSLAIMKTHFATAFLWSANATLGEDGLFND